MSETYQKISETEIKIIKTDEEIVSLDAINEELILRQNQLDDLNSYYQDNQKEIQSEIDALIARIAAAKSFGVGALPVDIPIS